jgi:hypothetical protein
VIGAVHWKRYFISSPPLPEGFSGQALMFRDSFVR